LLLLSDLLKRRATLRYTLKNDFKSYGHFHLLPEFELGVTPEGRAKHIRIAFLTHELWITINKE
jgi:hypothetical protein